MAKKAKKAKKPKKAKKAKKAQPRLRCYTRSLKNARYLREVAPDIFAKDPDADGFGTGVPIEILRGLHRIPHNSPLLKRYKAVADFIREHPLPVPGRTARDALFSGTIHFAQITFRTNRGNKVVPTADMNQIVQYTQNALVPISEYASEYGPNSVSVSPTLLMPRALAFCKCYATIIGHNLSNLINYWVSNGS